MSIAAIADSIGAGRPFIVDGGLGSELAVRGYDIETPLWSAELIRAQPEALRAVHLDYLLAGARCITTASYQASFPGLAALGLGAAEIEAVFRASVEIAADARDEFLRRHPHDLRPLIAASVGPYGAWLADGSEYRGNYGLDDAGLVAFHAPRLEILDRSGADLLACETIPDLQEARVLCELLGSTSTPAWLSFCCRDDRTLHDGHSLDAAVALAAACDGIFAIGVNCCAPAHVEGAIRRIRAADTGKLIVVYPNSGQQYDAEARDWRGAQELTHWSSLAAGWFAAGADIIGGCCQIGPRHIRELATRKTWPC